MKGIKRLAALSRPKHGTTHVPATGTGIQKPQVSPLMIKDRTDFHSLCKEFICRVEVAVNDCFENANTPKHITDAIKGAHDYNDLWYSATPQAHRPTSNVPSLDVQAWEPNDEGEPVYEATKVYFPRFIVLPSLQLLCRN
jgi:hypothetical protein